MSHHSLKSWRSFISRYSSEVDTLKKKTFIARRKAENVTKREEASGVIASPPIEDKSSPEPEASGSMQQSVQDIDPDGFKTMTEFFADGFADNMSDDQVWEALAEWVSRLFPSGAAVLNVVLIASFSDSARVARFLGQEWA